MRRRRHGPKDYDGRTLSLVRDAHREEKICSMGGCRATAYLQSARVGGDLAERGDPCGGRRGHRWHLPPRHVGNVVLRVRTGRAAEPVAEGFSRCGRRPCRVQPWDDSHPACNPSRPRRPRPSATRDVAGDRGPHGCGARRGGPRVPPMGSPTPAERNPRRVGRGDPGSPRRRRRLRLVTGNSAAPGPNGPRAAVPPLDVHGAGRAGPRACIPHRP